MKAPWNPTASPEYRRKMYLGASAILAIMVGGGLTGYQRGRPRYLRWKSSRAIADARFALKNHDVRLAELNLRIAASAGFTSDGYAALAEYDESVGSADAVAARKMVVKTEPRNLAARLALIAAALRFDDTAAATEAIAEATPQERTDLRIQSATALLAVRTRRLALANQLFDQMLAASPQDPSIRFARDALLVRNPHPDRAAVARQDLGAVVKTAPDLRLPALRTLLEDALHRGDAASAQSWARQLLDEPKLGLSDLLNAADGLALIHPDQQGELGSGLRTRVEDLARENEAATIVYAKWLVARNRGGHAAHWLDGLDPEMRREPRLVAMRAVAAQASAEWDDLEFRLKAGAWGPVSATALDFGFTARALQQRGEDQLALRVFDAALAECASSKVGLQVLAYLSEAWRWQEAESAASGALVRGFPNDPAGYPGWTARLRSQGDTSALRDALDGWRHADPGNVAARYNWALAALLLERNHPPKEAVEIMEGLYRADPTNPLFVTGAAFARFRIGHVSEAAELMSKMRPNALQRPERAPYAAIIFAAGGQHDAARGAAKVALPVQRLLPEERELLREAALLDGG